MTAQESECTLLSRGQESVPRLLTCNSSSWNSDSLFETARHLHSHAHAHAHISLPIMKNKTNFKT